MLTRDGRTGCEGFTLIEMMVVIFLIGLAAALVAPVLRTAERAQESALAPVIRGARETASLRGETVRLHIAGSGRWDLVGASSLEEGVLARGELEGFRGGPLTLVVSPLGTCAFDVRSASAMPPIAIDPLTCEVAAP